MPGVTERKIRSASATALLDERIDAVAVEEPLEIRLAGEPLAITMRTPGEDRQLALGFLFSEGLIATRADIGSVAHCGRPGEEGYGNTIDLIPGPGAVIDPERMLRSRRGTLTTAACGVCGRRSIDDLMARMPYLEAGPVLGLDLLARSPKILAEAQPHFDRTGGIHAAAALLADGQVAAVAEDVGRHNAVDKVVGALLLGGQLGEGPGRSPALLVVSGRSSFEIVQKAAMARIPCVASVSAPTSLAIDLADRIGITLAGFVRDGQLNVYTHRSRLVVAR